MLAEVAKKLLRSTVKTSGLVPVVSVLINTGPSILVKEKVPIWSQEVPLYL